LSSLSNRTEVMVQTEEQLVVTKAQSYSLFNFLFFGSVLGVAYFVYRQYVKKQDPGRRKKNDHLYV